MAEHGFPPGPLLLTDWGPPTPVGSAAAPRTSSQRSSGSDTTTRTRVWSLVGDDGQRDPQIYAVFAAAHPQAVIAVAIRQLTRTQRTLAIGARAASEPATPVEPSDIASCWVTGADGYELATALDHVPHGSAASPISD